MQVLFCFFLVSDPRKVYTPISLTLQEGEHTSRTLKLDKGEIKVHKTLFHLGHQAESTKKQVYDLKSHASNNH